MEPNRTTIEQGRAAFAYEAAAVGADKTKKHKPSEYKAYVSKLPMYIKTNGLGAAVAFAFAKGSRNGEPDTDKAWGLIYQQIEDWLKNHWLLSDFNKGKTLMQSLLGKESSEYRAATIEVLALLNWMKRFSEGLIHKEDNNG